MGTEAYGDLEQDVKGSGLGKPIFVALSGVRIWLRLLKLGLTLLWSVRIRNTFSCLGDACEHADDQQGILHLDRVHILWQRNGPSTSHAYHFLFINGILHPLDLTTLQPSVWDLRQLNVHGLKMLAASSGGRPAFKLSAFAPLLTRGRLSRFDHADLHSKNQSEIWSKIDRICSSGQVAVDLKPFMNQVPWYAECAYNEDW